MNTTFHGVHTCTSKKQASQLIVELGKTISNPQRQALTNLYLALDTADSLLTELEYAHRIIRQCMHQMNDEQIIELSNLNQDNNLPWLWAFHTYQRQNLIERAERIFRAR